MTLRTLLEQELARQPSGGPLTVQVATADGVALRLEIAQLDSMSCALTELSLFVPQLQNAAFDALKQWAQALSGRITYLLEQIGPLEFDPQHGEVLIRSTPPQQLPSGTQYYEMMLSSTGSGTFVLRRFSSVSGTPGRTAVDMQLTREVLLRLVEDLQQTIPSVP